MDELLNPYSVGGSLSDPNGWGFVGREDVFDFVRQSLQAVRRPPIVLYGQRRIGKSSVLRQLPRHLPTGTVCVYFDLQGQAALPLDVLLYGLARELAGACGLPRPARQDIHAETFGDFLAAGCAALGSARRLVLLFDEFDVVDASTGSAGSGFLPYLAALIDRHPDVGLVMVVGRKLAELSDGFAGSILRNAVHHRIARLTKPQSDLLALLPAHSTLAFGRRARERLYELAAGHPYCTQLLCNMVWQRLVRPGETGIVSVSADDVQQALAPAVEYGTSGLSWIYDGLEMPSHRLFLGALAELQGEQLPDRAVTMLDIEQRLLKRHTVIDAAELRTAPARLSNWDVVDGGPAGFRFAVPMIGLWVRLNRPLVELEAQTQLVNPRAWRAYEQAAQSQQDEQWSEAIALYQRALEANPALVEANLGLASSYRARNDAGDLERAIEAYERALALDVNAPRAALMQALAEQVERNALDPAVQVTAYRRLVDLDAGASAAGQAWRCLHHLATLRLAIPKQLEIAEMLFATIGDKEGSEAVRQVRLARKPRQRVSRIGGWVWISGLLLSPTVSFLPLTEWTGWPAPTWTWLARLAAAASIGGIALLMAEDATGPLWRHWLLAAVGAILTVGLSLTGWNLALMWFVGFMITAAASEFVAPTPKLPSELKPPPAPSNRPPRPLASTALRLSAWLQRFAQQVESKKP